MHRPLRMTQSEVHVICTPRVGLFRLRVEVTSANHAFRYIFANNQELGKQIILDTIEYMFWQRIVN